MERWNEALHCRGNISRALREDPGSHSSASRLASEGNDLGLFLCSGPQDPPVGFLVARAKSMSDLEAMFAEEPFNVAKLASYTFKEFQPVNVNRGLRHGSKRKRCRPSRSLGNTLSRTRAWRRGSGACSFLMETLAVIARRSQIRQDGACSKAGSNLAESPAVSFARKRESGILGPSDGKMKLLFDVIAACPGSRPLDLAGASNEQRAGTSPSIARLPVRLRRP